MALRWLPALALSAACTGDTIESDAAPDPAPRADVIVVVVVDDLGDNYFWGLPRLAMGLTADAVRFTNTYVTTPLCCPARASILSGGAYPRDVGVISNELPNGGFGSFRDVDTLATRMQAGGYRTALIGKYLNGYEVGEEPYVPPGWDLFLGATWVGTSYDTQLVRGSSTATAAATGEWTDVGGTYNTDFLFGTALDFLDGATDSPTFVLVTLTAVHPSNTPPAEDQGSWAGYRPRPPSFEEADLGDKPAWLQSWAADVAATDRNFDPAVWRMGESLASIDRGMAALSQRIEALGLADRTAIVFTGDNGFLHGEHWLDAKGLPYEEAVRVPLLVRLPGGTPREDDRLVAMNLDLPATVAELAGVDVVSEGMSLARATLDPTRAPQRDHVFIDAAAGDHPPWAGVVTDRWKYVEWGDGDRELYDLHADPYELESLHASPPEEADVERFSAWVDENRPLAITTDTAATATSGTAYTAKLTSWGGTPPLTWEVEGGHLPGGLSLAADGTVSGIPSLHGSFLALIRVTDSVPGPLTGEPAHFSHTVEFPVDPPNAIAPRPPLFTQLSTEPPIFRVNTQPGLAVQVCANRDDTWDNPGSASATVTADGRGTAVVALPTLDPAWSWHLRVVVDGVPRAVGLLQR